MNIYSSNIMQLKLAANIIRESEHPEYEPLTDKLLDQLIIHVMRYYSNDNYVSLFDQPYAHACACMGPRDGEPFCICAMSYYVYEYRYDIALKIQIYLRLQAIKNKLIENA